MRIHSYAPGEGKFVSILRVTQIKSKYLCFCLFFSGLVVRQGKPEVVIPDLVQKLGADSVQALVFQEGVIASIGLDK